MSDRSIVEYGVLQVTFLGLVLLKIYINPLYNLKTNGSVVAFEDDAVLFC